jgi:hypothetical protein
MQSRSFPIPADKTSLTAEFNTILKSASSLEINQSSLSQERKFTFEP